MNGLTIEKEKLPKGHSYPLKTSMLTPLLETLPKDFETHLIYRKTQGENWQSVLEVFLWLPNEHISTRRLYVRVGSVLSEGRRIISEEIASRALPVLKNWLGYLNGLPENSNHLLGEPRFEAYIWEGEMKVSCQPQHA